MEPLLRFELRYRRSKRRAQIHCDRGVDICPLGRDRTCISRFRRPVPYPLGHEGMSILRYWYFDIGATPACHESIRQSDTHGVRTCWRDASQRLPGSRQVAPPAGVEPASKRFRNPQPGFRQDGGVESRTGIEPAHIPFAAEALTTREPRPRAGEGNRTPASWMATTCSTFELHLQTSRPERMRAIEAPPSRWERAARPSSYTRLYTIRAGTEDRTPILRLEIWCLTIRPCPHVMKENTSLKVDTSLRSEVLRLLAAPWGSHPPFTVPEVPLVPSARARAESPRSLRSNGARADEGNRTPALLNTNEALRLGATSANQVIVECEVHSPFGLD